MTQVAAWDRRESRDSSYLERMEQTIAGHANDSGESSATVELNSLLLVIHVMLVNLLLSGSVTACCL